MNSSMSSRLRSDLVSVYNCLCNGMIPSTRVVPEKLESVLTELYSNFTGSSLPYKMIFWYCLDNWFHETFSENLKCRAKDASCWPRQPVKEPNPGSAIAPFRIDTVLSGITRSGSNYCLYPIPWHSSQAPNGELKLNIRGCNSSKLISCSSHESFFEYDFESFPDLTTTKPFASPAAVSIASAIRDWFSFKPASRSTTTSMLCFFCLSKSSLSPAEYENPSIKNRANPFFPRSSTIFS